MGLRHPRAKTGVGVGRMGGGGEEMCRKGRDLIYRAETRCEPRQRTVQSEYDR